MMAPTPPTTARPPRPGPLALTAWCLYDWANSALPTVIVTFVFATYFTGHVAPDRETGTAWWAWAISGSALAVAVVAPVLGAIADFSGRRKPWLAVFTVLCIGATAPLWWVRPNPDDALLALGLVALANFAFEMGMVFYNAMLPDLAPRSLIGRLSGWAWGVGYAGGLACLAVVLVGLVQTDAPWFGLDPAAAEPVRATAPLVAAWFAVFALPLFLVTPDTPATGLGAADAVRRGLGALRATAGNLRDYKGIVVFLVARMLYIDGLTTLFAFGGIYAAGTFGMEFAELIQFAIGMNVAAGLGAAAFAWIDDRAGPKRTLQISILALMACAVALLVVESKTLFWVFGLALSVFIGPVQAASRSWMAHAAPPGMHTEMFGLFALSGKATAFLGPFVLGWVTLLTGSQRAGMATILAFLAAGLVLLARVPDVRR